jgi:hypothetical protein
VNTAPHETGQLTERQRGEKFKNLLRIEPSPETEAAMARAAAALSERAKIRAAVETARTNVTTSEVRFNQAKSSYAAAEAIAALQGTATGPSASKEMITAETALNKARALVAGLTQRLSDNAAELTQAASELRIVQTKNNAALLQRFRGIYQSAAEDFAIALRWASVIEIILGRPFATQTIILCDPENPNVEAVPVFRIEDWAGAPEVDSALKGLDRPRSVLRDLEAAVAEYGRNIAAAERQAERVA